MRLLCIGQVPSHGAETAFVVGQDASTYHPQIFVMNPTSVGTSKEPQEWMPESKLSCATRVKWWVLGAKVCVEFFVLLSGFMTHYAYHSKDADGSPNFWPSPEHRVSFLEGHRIIFWVAGGILCSPLLPLPAGARPNRLRNALLCLPVAATGQLPGDGALHCDLVAPA